MHVNANLFTIAGEKLTHARRLRRGVSKMPAPLCAAAELSTRQHVESVVLFAPGDRSANNLLMHVGCMRFTMCHVKACNFFIAPEIARPASKYDTVIR